MGARRLKYDSLQPFCLESSLSPRCGGTFVIAKYPASGEFSPRFNPGLRDLLNTYIFVQFRIATGETNGIRAESLLEQRFSALILRKRKAFPRSITGLRGLLNTYIFMQPFIQQAKQSVFGQYRFPTSGFPRLLESATNDP